MQVTNFLKAVVVSSALVVSGASVAETVKTDLYTVTDGIMVDENTFEGFKTWRAAACDRCHGANQQGLVGPSLLESMKVLTKEEFVVTIRDGRLARGMQSFGTSKKVMANMDNLYAYLKARSDGALKKSKPKKMKK
ncbi:MAG: c-type cytochrome [Burkholderiaceae bacterium]